MGATGTLLQGVKLDEWTSFDHFGAVRFDCCGHTRSIVLKSLDIPQDDREMPPASIATAPPQGELTEHQIAPAAQRSEEYHGFLLEDRGFGSWVARDAGRRVYLSGNKPDDVRMKVRAFRKYGDRIAGEIRALLSAEGIALEDVGFDASQFGMTWTFRTGLPQAEAGSRVRYDLRKASAKSGAETKVSKGSRSGSAVEPDVQ